MAIVVAGEPTALAEVEGIAVRVAAVLEAVVLVVVLAIARPMASAPVGRTKSQAKINRHEAQED